MDNPDGEGREFNGCGRGWLLDQSGSARPLTVSGGRVLELCRWPDGAIGFALAAE